MSKTILFLVSEDWVFVSHRLHLAKYAIANQYKVTLACNVSTFDKVIEREGIQLLNWQIKRGSKNPITFVENVLKTRRIIRECEPDIIMAVALKPVILTGFAKISLRLEKCFLCVTGLGSVFTGRGIFFLILRVFVRLVLSFIIRQKDNELVVQNTDDEAFFCDDLKIPRAKTHLIKGAGVDVDRFCPVAENNGMPIVSLPARALRDKGIVEFVKVAGMVNKKEKKAFFQLIGAPDPSNPNSISLPQLEKWHEQGFIDWVGHQSDMISAIRATHIICFPSYREGLPKALLEACACGKPIVAFDVPGVREIVHDQKNGYLVPFGDIVNMARCVDRLLDDQPLRKNMGRAGRAMVEGEFSQTNVQDKFGKLWS